MGAARALRAPPDRPDLVLERRGPPARPEPRDPQALPDRRGRRERRGLERRARLAAPVRPAARARRALLGRRAQPEPQEPQAIPARPARPEPQARRVAPGQQAAGRRDRRAQLAARGQRGLVAARRGRPAALVQLEPRARPAEQEPLAELELQVLPQRLELQARQGIRASRASPVRREPPALQDQLDLPVRPEPRDRLNF